MAWPVYFRDSLTLGRSDAPIAVCSLWTPRELFHQLLKELPISLVGNLYSADGISYILRNILANPQVRVLVICGRDLNNSGALLLQFFEEGLDDNGYIAGTSVTVHPEIDRGDLETLRRSLIVYDYRNVIRYEQLFVELHRDLPALLSYRPVFDTPRIYPDHQPETTEFPSEPAGMTFQVGTVAQGFNVLVRHLMLFGRVSGTAYGSRQKELIHTTIVINDEDGSWSPDLPIDQETIDRHKQLLQKQSALGAGDASYTYGHRIHDHFMDDQLEQATKRIREHGETRRAVAVLWDPDIDQYSDTPPCLTLLQFQLREGRLHCTAYFRSHDAWRAWLPNVYGVRSIQEEVASDLDVDAGSLLIVGNSSHIYEENWEVAQEYCDNITHKNPRLIRDPRGSFNILLEGATITVNHYDVGGSLIDSLSSESAAVIARKLLNFSSEPTHTFYLGRELQKVVTARQLGIAYKQDEDLDFGTLLSTEE